MKRIVAASAVLVALALSVAQDTRADPAEPQILCAWLDRNPTLYGGLAGMRYLDDSGVPTAEVPHEFARTIARYCPRHIAIFYAVRDYLTAGVVSPIAGA